MRIAVSGAHSQGKSTFVHDWVARHPQYIREEEPFRALHAEGLTFASVRNVIVLIMACRCTTTSAASMLTAIQLTASSLTVAVDYIAYSQYTANYQTTDIDDAFVQMMVPAVRRSLQQLDWLVFFPITNDGQWRWKTMGSTC